MKHSSIINCFVSILFLFSFVFSCSQRVDDKGKNIAVVRIKRYPNSLNYFISNNSQATLIEKHIYNTLLWVDEKSNAIPLLVKSTAAIEEHEKDVVIKYEIRKEAVWDNQEPITSNDVLFSLKVFKLPVPSNSTVRVYLKRIKRAILDTSNSKFISFIVKGNSKDAAHLTGDFDILQKDKFDPKGLLDHISLNDIENQPEKVASDPNVKAFLDEFLKHNFKFKGEYLGGSGPYEITAMEQGKYIRLKKKKNWWGESLVGKLPQFHAYPEEILYVCIPEALVAIQALKTRSIDVMSDIPTNEFVQLQKDSSFLEDFNLFSPLKYKFTYIGFNSRINHLKNKNIRGALALLVKTQDIIKVVDQGYGEKTVGPINPANEYFYNNNITSRIYDPNQAQKVFLDNGFQLIDGELVDPQTNEQLEFDVAFRQNPGYESIAQMLKEEANSIGIKLNLKQYEGRTFSKIIRYHDFEIIVSAFNGNPVSLGFSEIFSQESAKINGMNFTGFGNARSDSLIQAANYAEDSVSKRQALFALQEELHEEATMLFLYFSKNKIAINKKFDNLKISTTKPGYDVTSFILKNPSNSN